MPAAVRQATWRLRPMPDFLIIGAQKAGTKSLQDVLRAHPQVSIGVKEPQYFAFNYGLGEPWYRLHFPVPRPWRSSRQRIGECSTYYLNHPMAPERVAARLPDVRILVLLRNPIERAFSGYRHEVRAGREHRSFEQAIEEEAELLQGEEERIRRGEERRWAAHEIKSYVERSRYGPQLRRWLSLFAHEQMLILKSEDLFGAGAESGISRVLQFLRLDYVPIPMARQNVGIPGEMSESLRLRLALALAKSNAEVASLTGITWDGPESVGVISE